MKLTPAICVLAVAISQGACSSVDTCEEPEFYESARAGKRIETPEGLDDLAASKELIVPDASPRAARPPGSGCLDRPPSLSLEET
ncbi:MAG: hypothetical protein O3A13_10505 [Proteobacteria bacterium]|nr:hypothetical protein [Pseudomonadota bacterium]MDA0994044.1 hypothetical protein [Pseudomonadota bacterium]